MFASAATFVIPVIIILSTFTCGILIERASNTGRKKAYYLLGLSVNLGLLVFFKYANFFIATAFDLVNFADHSFSSGKNVDHPSFLLQFAVPLGISYITFQAIGYLIEIKRGNQPSEKNLGLFATYLLFFPKLLSGPIERAHRFIPQLRQEHQLNYLQVVVGLKRILWGLFLKLVVANRLALYTDAVFHNFKQHSGVTLFLAAVFFPIQLYADFAGYTDMAIGSAQILGYRLMENFDSPFIAKSVTEFWRRWHISLTTWVNEYVYNPIVVSYRRWNKWAIVFAIMTTFIVIGFWHGASWNYIIFGFLQGTALSVEFFSRKFRKRARSKIPLWLNTFLGIGYTFGFFCFSAIFFKATTATDAFSIVRKISTFKGALYFENPSTIIYTFFAVFFLIAAGLIHVLKGDRGFFFNSKSGMVRKLSYAFLIIIILLTGVFDGGQFIYFQF